MEQVLTFEAAKREFTGRKMELAKGKKSISRKDVEEITNLKQTAAGSLLRSLVEQNLLLREGSGKNTEYIIK